MEESYIFNSDNKRNNSTDININTDIYNYNKNKYKIKSTSFLDYENISNNNDLNDFLINSDTKYNFENDNYNENDISSEDEYESKLKYIKIGILTAKLKILNKIIYSKIQKNYYYFISKVKLKIKSNEIFLHGDNFLYSKLKPKTSEVNKYYAFKKIIYIFRKNKYEKSIKEAYFNKWKLIKNKFFFDKKQKTNCIKIVNFCSILISILNKKLEKQYKRKYYLSKWEMLTNYDDIQINKIRKAMLILSNLFNRKIRHIFRKFPRNYLNIKNKANIFKRMSNVKQISYIIEDNDIYYQKGLRDFYDIKKKYNKLIKQNKLLKIIEKLDIKKRVDKNIYVFFNILKNITKKNQYKKEQIRQLSAMLSDLKFDSMLNAATMIKIILNNHINNDLFICKKYFFQKLYNYSKFFRLYTQYKKDYNFIFKKLKNENGKEQIKLIRSLYKKIYALQKILIINNRHKFFYSDLNIQLKKSLLQNYFYIWRYKVFNKTVDNYIKTLGIQKLFVLLDDIYTNKIKRTIFFFIKKKVIKESFNKRKYYYFCYYIYYILKRYILIILLKDAFYSIKNYGNNNDANSKVFKVNIYFKSKKMFMIYKKYINLKKYKYLIKWHFTSSFITQRNEKFKEKITKLLINLDNSNYQKLLLRIINRWKKNIFIPNDKNQINEVRKNFFLYKFISTKSLMLKWFHFKKWLNTNNNPNNVLNYEKLLMELDQLRKDNDDLIAMYYAKRQEYAKTLYDYNYMKKYYCVKCINENEDEIDYMSLKSNDIREAGKITTSIMVSQNRIDISKDNSKNMKSKNYEEKDENKQNKISYGLSSDGNNNFIVNEENKLQSSNSNIISLSDDEDMNSHIGKKIPQCTGETIFSKNLFIDDNISRNSNNNINNKRKKDNEDDGNKKESIIKEYEKEYEEQQKYYENYIKILLEKKNELIQMKNMLKNQKNESLKSNK